MRGSQVATAVSTQRGQRDRLRAAGSGGHSVHGTRLQRWQGDIDHNVYYSVCAGMHMRVLTCVCSGTHVCMCVHTCTGVKRGGASCVQMCVVHACARVCASMSLCVHEAHALSEVEEGITRPITRSIAWL